MASSSSALKMAAALMLALCAGQLLLAVPAAAAADGGRLLKGRSLLGTQDIYVPSCPGPCNFVCFSACYKLCYVDLVKRAAGCVELCYGQCKA